MEEFNEVSLTGLKVIAEQGLEGVFLLDQGGKGVLISMELSFNIKGWFLLHALLSALDHLKNAIIHILLSPACTLVVVHGNLLHELLGDLPLGLDQGHQGQNQYSLHLPGSQVCFWSTSLG